MGVLGAPKDFNFNPALRILAEVLASDPTGGGLVEGRFWYNSTTKLLKLYDGTNKLVLGKLDDILPPDASVDLNSQKITNLATPTVAGDAASRGYVLALKVTDLTAPTASFDMNAQKITGLADGTSASDAATRGQLDAAALGLDLREEAVAAMTTNVTVSNPGTASFDTITLSNGDRLMLAGQTAPAENGLYIFNGSGSALTRAPDFDTAGDMDRGILIPVAQGTNRGLWLHTTPGAITVGTTALSFINLMVPSVGYAAFAANYGDGAATSFNIDHNLNTKDVSVDVYKNSDGAEWELNPVRSTVNRVVLVHTVAPTTDEFRVVVKK